MIIVFFHVLYLIGKMVYDNYHSAKRKDENAIVEASCVPAKNSRKIHGDIPDADYDEDDDGPRAPRFSPPAYVQRYLAVQKILADPRYQGKIKKVVDFGCSELGFVTHMKNTPGIEEILCVDVDREVLEHHKDKAMPLNVDYIINRPQPLTISVYEGSVTHSDKRLQNCDAVIAIELIEHLYPETLMDFPHNVFGYVRPLVAAITTPNADFNVLFPRMGNSFRHWDHKFEWTREQFEDWAKNITSRYPEYEVSFQGIGPGPSGTEELGCCSQMAIFARTRESEVLPIHGVEGLLKSVTIQEFPHRIDNRSDEEKILDEAAYYIRRFTRNNPDCLEEYPLAHLLANLEKFCVSAATLREILENGGYAVIENPEGPTVACPAPSTFSDYEEDLENDIQADDEWQNDFGESSNYRDEIGAWEIENVENAYAENWDDDCELPNVIRPDNEVSAVNEIADPSNIISVELSWTRSLDTADLDDLEISYISHVPSASESIEQDRLAPFVETLESNPDTNGIQNFLPRQDDETVINNVKSNGDSRRIDESTGSIKMEKSSENFRDASNLEEHVYGNGDTTELGSLCSMYLEASRDERFEECPENITNPSFECEALEVSFEDVKTSTKKDSQLRERLSLPSCNDSTNPQFASSPRASTVLPIESQRTSALEDADELRSVSQTSLQSNGNASSTTSTSGSSFATIKKWYPPEINPMYNTQDPAKLRGGNEFSDRPVDEPTSGSEEISPSESFVDVEQQNLHVTRLQRQKAPGSLELRSTTSSKDAIESLSSLGVQGTSSKNQSSISEHFIASERLARTAEEDLAISSRGNSRTNGNSSHGISDNAEAKPASPETPPNSCSPEIMDSGYPNSTSTQDMTPEYDLSSIAQDRISDEESPSVAEAPRLGFLEHVEVENGDLANNNRDGEGNNMIAEAENVLDEDLQPLIDVLENDIENENDIYALENDFPMWLLRILERGNAAARHAVVEVRAPANDVQADVHAAGDAGRPDLDEGFDSTSSENDDDSDAEDYNIEELSTESSEENIEWDGSGDYRYSP